MDMSSTGILVKVENSPSYASPWRWVKRWVSLPHEYRVPYSQALRIVTIVLLAGLLPFIASCSGPAKLAKKAAWFTITTTGRIAFKTVSLGAHAAYKGVSAGADRLIGDDRNEAARVSRRMIGLFWSLLRREKYEAAYRMFSPQLRSVLALRVFEQQTAVFARNIKRQKIREPKVGDRSVEIPTDMKVEMDGQRVTARATASLVRIDHQWYIDGWEIEDGSKLPALKDLDRPEMGDEATDTSALP